MKNLFTVLFTISFCLSIFAQNTITLKPNNIAGKDALIHGLNSQVDNNHGNNPQFGAVASTFSGTPGVVRSLIEFDLSVIPPGAIIQNANLSLYAWYTTGGFGQHSSEGGPNTCLLQRVTSPWNENTVTWNTQPSSTSINEVILPEASDPNQNYLDIDVSQLVQDMVDNPTESHGFLLRLQAELFYRWMNFVSSNDDNEALHPELVITYLNPMTSDSCFSIRPDDIIGKDALLHGLTSEANENYGNNAQLGAAAATFGGIPGNIRGLIDFDLSAIPSGATIDGASLSLYAWYTPTGLGQHSTQDGPNTCILQRVTSPWEESTVTWNNQPSTTNQNEVTIPATTSINQNYLEIDVSTLVQDMIDFPSESHGFLLKLEEESFYRLMNFVSSDDENIDLRPKIDICYSNTVSTINPQENSTTLNIYPNPTKNHLTVEHNLDLKNTCNLIDACGKRVSQIENISNKFTFSVKNYPKGIYFLHIYDKQNYSIEKIVIN